MDFPHILIPANDANVQLLQATTSIDKCKHRCIRMGQYLNDTSSGAEKTLDYFSYIYSFVGVRGTIFNTCAQ